MIDPKRGVNKTPFGLTTGVRCIDADHPAIFEVESSRGDGIVIEAEWAAENLTPMVFDAGRAWTHPASGAAYRVYTAGESSLLMLAWEFDPVFDRMGESGRQLKRIAAGVTPETARDLDDLFINGACCLTRQFLTALLSDHAPGWIEDYQRQFKPSGDAPDDKPGKPGKPGGGDYPLFRFFERNQ